MSKEVTIFLVYSEAFIRDAFKTTLQSRSGFRVIGEANNGEQALRAIRVLRPKIVLCDSHFEGFSGIELASRISRGQPETRILVFSRTEEGVIPGRVMEAGASGYLSAECSTDEIALAIEKVAGGEVYLSRSIAQRMALHKPHEGSLVSRLSPRELEVGMMLVQGYRCQEIANLLSVSVKTISTHKSRLFAKLNVTNVPKLVAVFRAEGLDATPLD